MISFKNKNILITGASGGIGNALIKKFVTLGGNVLGTGTKAEKLDMIKKNIQILKLKNLIYLNIQELKNLSIMLFWSWEGWMFLLIMLEQM